MASNQNLILEEIDRLDIATAGDGSLSVNLQYEAEEEIHEKPKWIDRDVDALREMVLKEPGLKSRTDKPFLLTFLRARKFDYERAMGMIQRYYASRQYNPEFYTNLRPSVLSHVWAQNFHTVLSKPDLKGRTVLIVSTANWVPEQMSLEDIFRAQILILEHIVRLPLTQLKGVTVVVDCKGITLSHTYYVTPVHIKKMVAAIQGVFPLRFKSLHFVNHHTMFEWIFSLIKPFLSETVKGRLHFHGNNMKELHNYISPTILPEEFGGDIGPLNNSRIVSLLHVNEDYFAEHFSYGYLTNMKREDNGTQDIFGSMASVGSHIGNYYRRLCIE